MSVESFLTTAAETFIDSDFAQFNAHQLINDYSYLGRQKLGDYQGTYEFLKGGTSFLPYGQQIQAGLTGAEALGGYLTS